MRLLLDTHVWLWMSERPERIRRDVLEQLDDETTERVFSAVVAYEVGVKAALQKLTLPAAASVWVHDRMEAFRASSLAITVAHCCSAADLPMHHRDPFDRLLIAQAQVEGLTLVTADGAFRHYAVPILWAT